MENFTWFRSGKGANKTKRWLGLLTFCMMMTSMHSFAQIWEINNCLPSTLGTTTYGPMYSTTNSSATNRTAMIYQSSILTGIAGQELTGIYFNKVTTADMTGTPNLKIYLKETTDTDFGSGATDWTTVITGATLVYDGSPVTAAAGSSGWKEFSFSSNFIYTGTQNLVLITEYVNTGNTVNTTWLYEYTNPCIDTSNNNTTKYTNNTTGTPGGSLGSSNYRRPMIGFDFTVDCPAPSDILIDAITTTGATITWTAGDAETNWDYAVQSQGAGIPTTFESTTSTTLVLTDLSPSTGYEFYVRANCGGDDGESVWKGPYTFYTACGVITSGFYEGFDTTDTGSSSNPTVPQCWTMIDTGAGYGYVSATTPNTAPRNFYMYNGSTADTGTYILVSPETNDLGNGTMRVKFWARTTSSTTDPAVTIDFGTLSDNTDETTFTVVQSIPITNVYTEYVVIIPVTTDDYFGIRHDLVTKARYIYIDTITYEEIPSCLEAYDLDAVNITNNSAELSWTSAGTLFDIEHGETGFTPTGTPTHTGVTNNFIITSLNHSTTYDYYVRQDCGDGDLSAWQGPFTFTTACDVVTGPFYEGFDTTDTGSSSNPTVPQCWTMIDTGAGYGYVSATTPNTAPRNFYMYNGAAADTGHYILVSPETDNLGNGTMRVRFWARTTVSTAPATQVTFGTLSNNTDASSFTAIETFDLTTTYQEFVVIIPATTDDYFGFRHDINTRPRYIYIDTITYEQIPSCLEVTETEVTGVSFTSADLAWTSTGTLFDIEYGEAGFTPTGTPSTGYSGIAGTSVTLTGLTAETDYEYYIRQDCGASDLSVWTGPFSFYTGYCIPSVTSTSTLYRITGFSTTDGYTNISNENNGITDSYNDYTNMAVTQSAGGSFDFHISVAANVMVEVWLDLDQNLIFDPVMELLAAFGTGGTTPATTYTGSMLIPMGTPLGDYRFRIRSRYYSGSTATPCGTLTYGETEDYTLTVVEVPDCLPPSGITGTGLSLTSAELSWTSAGSLFDIEYGASGFTPTETPTVAGVSNPYTVTTPSPGAYDFYVRQDCGATDGVSMWAGPYTLVIGAYDQGDIPTQYETSANVSINSDNYCTPEPTLTIEVPAGMQIAGLQVQYAMTAANGAWTSEQRTFIYSPTLNMGENALVTGTEAGGGSAAGTIQYNRSMTFANGAIGTVDFVLRAWRTYGSTAPNNGCGTHYNKVDNGTWVITPTFEPLPPCPTPIGLSAVATSFTTADLSWMSPGTTFEIEYGEAGFTPTGTPSTGLTGVSNPYTLTGLTAETDYEFYVRQDCDTDGVSGWAGPYAFYTGYCIPDISSTSTLYKITGFSTTDGYVNISNENNGSTVYSDFSDMFVMQSPGGTFNYSISVAANVMVEVWIDLDQDLVFDPVMELLATFGTGGTNPATTYEGSMLIPTGTPLGEYRFRIRSRYYSGTTATPCGTITNGETEDYTLIIVDTPNCLPPTGLGAENISYDSADLFWTLDDGTSFDIEYGIAGFTPTETPSTGLVGVANPYTLTGLTPVTDYEYYVRQNCGGIDGESIWVGPFSFSTECLPPAITGTTPGSVCGLGEVTLAATADAGATIAWYDAETSGNKLGEGETFVTPEISETTSFWVAAYTGGGTEYIGPVNPSIGTGGYTTLSTYVTYFTVTSATTIQSVDIFANSTAMGVSGSIVINDITNGGIVGTYPYTVTQAGDLTTSQTITINQPLPPGDYSMGMGSAAVSLYRNTAGATFPYTGTDVVLTGQSFSGYPNYFYYFYNWSIASGCYSDRTEVIATVTTPPAFELSATEASICEGETTGAVTITTGATDYDTFVWEPATGVTGDATTGWTFAPTETTTYTLATTQSAGVCGTVATYTVTVNSIPEFSVNTTTVEMCAGDAPVMLTTLPAGITIGTPATGCLTYEYNPYPAATYTPANCDGTVYNITTAAWASEYSTVNVIAGNLYIFSSSIATDITTISDSAGTEIYAAGTGNVIWVADFTGVVRFYSHIENCGNQQSARARRVACTTSSPVTWSPVTGLYTDAEGTVAYAGEEIFMVYTTPAATTTYTATATSGVCSFEQTVEITVNPIPEAPTGDTTQTLDDGDTLADLIVSGTDLVWYADEDLTQEIADTTPAVNGITYYVVSDSACQSAALAITVVIDPCAGVVTPTGATEQSLLLGQTLEGLTVAGDNLVWYSDEDLTMEIPETTAAVNGTTYYVVSETDDCQSDALAITVTVIDPCAEITTPTGDAEQTLDEGDTLAELVVDGDNLAWYADADLTQSLPATTIAQNGVTYYVASVTDICQSEPLAITVTLAGMDPCEDVTVPVPTGEEIQTLTEGQTLADLIVEGENLQWYADADLTEPLEETHVAEETTYYVTQTIGVCTGEALAVTVEFTVGTTDFEVFAFSFYPNPVGEVLNLTSNVEITQIDLFNMLGQKVNAFTNANNTQVDMSGLPTGNYIISVTIEGITKTFKVVKN